MYERLIPWCLLGATCNGIMLKTQIYYKIEHTLCLKLLSTFLVSVPKYFSNLKAKFKI